MMSLRDASSRTRTGILAPTMNSCGSVNHRSRFAADQLRPAVLSAGEYLYPETEPALRSNTPPSIGPVLLAPSAWHETQRSPKSCSPRTASGSSEAIKRERSLAFSGLTDRKKVYDSVIVSTSRVSG